MNRCEPAPLREMAELFLREATARPNCPEALVAHRIFGSTCFYFGDFAGAHGHFQKTIELYDQERHGDFVNRLPAQLGGFLPFALRVHQDGPAPRATARWTPEGPLRTTDRVPESKKSHRRPIMQ